MSESPAFVAAGGAPVDGDIVFMSPKFEFMRFRGSDGAILVKGAVVTSDLEVVEAFKSWLGYSKRGSGISTVPDSGCHNLVIQSGSAGHYPADGCNVTITNAIEPTS